MYQHIWFNKEAFSGFVDIKGVKPSDWIEDKDIEQVLLTCWCEHCLECAVPLCYHNCENWVERMDKKCQKTYYGTALLDWQGIKTAQLRFRKWGKIEACINASASTYERYKELYNKNIRIEKIAKGISNCIKWVSPTMKLCGAQNLFRDKYLRAIGKKGEYNTFIVQCYSPSELSYNLIVEFYTPSGVFYRNSVPVKKGFNQTLLNIGGKNLFEEEGSRARIYPENNLTEEIVFIKTDFVKLKEKEQEQPVKEEPAKKVKCVAWDLDKTVWDGILIESNPESLSLRPHIFETMKALDERGIIQVVVSKNDYAEVEPQLKRLGIFDIFVYVFANWNSKSENLKKAAELINININTFALIDDSNYERGEVKENIPCIRTFTENEIKEILVYPEFDVPVTEDGKNRRLMYQTEVKRKQIEQGFEGTNIDFLKSCRLEIDLDYVNDANILRCYELVQRTNQLNLSGIKYAKDEFVNLCKSHKESCFVASCKDKYGDYGIVGFFYVECDAVSIVIKEYAMSCRVASKWLEPRLMQWLSNYYKRDTVIFQGVNNKKNGLLIRTLKGFGMKDEAKEEGRLLLTIHKDDMNWQEVVTINENKINDKE